MIDINCSPEAIKELLKLNGIKCTTQRLEILQELTEKKCSLKAEEIYSALVLKGLRISLSTIYRVLEVLEEKAIITRHLLADGKTNCFEIGSSKESHSHSLICTDCRKTIRVKECPIDRIAVNLLETEGFEITEHNIQIYGKCKNCRKKQS